SGERGDPHVAPRGVGARAAPGPRRRTGRHGSPTPDHQRCPRGAGTRWSAADGDRRGSGRAARLGDGGRGFCGDPLAPRPARRRALHRRPVGARHASRARAKELLMATRLVIDGGQRLCGEVVVSAAKNAALPALCAALLTAEPLTLENVPDLADVATTRKLLARLGADISDGPSGATRVQ